MREQRRARLRRHPGRGPAAEAAHRQRQRAVGEGAQQRRPACRRSDAAAHPPARPNVAPARPPVAPAKPALPQSRPTTQATAVPQSAVPYRRDPARSYPTQKRPTYRGAYRHYDGFPGWYPIDVWPIGYADTYGCTMTGIESQPADLDGDGQPDPAAQW
ncbi:hypothetical protein [Nonomuraea recticatena]|uniref:hypothetical protein n=1 Tax=Nonomuraea recticatena TaxID=46178 RepID=UPI0036237B71